jgi:hypothetical protein
MSAQAPSLILVVNENEPSVAKANASGSFEALKIWERNHIQEWIRNTPEILGEDLLILSIEFDRFVESNDRLDILAMDKTGNLVVIELKRDSFAGYADLQALRYAAMISTLTIETILPYFITYHNKNKPSSQFDYGRAEEEIRNFASDSEEFLDFSQKPRIILCSENFSTELTTTVLWLREQCSVDLTCVRIKPHRVGEHIIIVPTIIIPIPEAKQYQTQVQQKEAAIQQEKTQRTKRPTSVRMLLEEGQISKGDVIYMKKELLPTDLQSYFDSRDSNFYTAVVSGKAGKSNNLIWNHDNETYSISNLCHQIFVDIHPENKHPGAISGADFWVAENGKTLYQWANEVWAEKQNA